MRTSSWLKSDARAAIIHEEESNIRWKVAKNKDRPQEISIYVHRHWQSRKQMKNMGFKVVMIGVD